jgi:hypothetical protein
MRATVTRPRNAMECPKCHFDHPQQVDECLKCGVIFAKYIAFQEAVEAVQSVAPESSPEDAVAAERRAHNEFLCRIFALPGALLCGWLVNHAMPTLAAFLSMWTHEFGHAFAAWFCGYTAFPTAWITIISDERSRWLSVVMGAGVIGGGYIAFRLERWFWVVVCLVVLVLVVAGNVQTDFHSKLLFTFWGDGGAYVLSTLLMMTFYARPNSPLTRNQVRWGLLLIGAIAFWSVYSRWAGGFENIANALADTDERGPSDVLQLTTMYGWSIYTLIHHYWDLGRACLLALAAAYAAGLVQAKRIETSLGTQAGSYCARAE